MKDNRVSGRCMVGEREAIRVEISGERTYFRIVKEKLVREHSLKIIVNGVEIGEYILSPEMIEEFVYGNLFTRGLIDGVEDVAEISYEGNRVIVTLKQKPKLRGSGSPLALTQHRVGQGYVVGKISSTTTISARQIVDVMESFLEKSSTFKATGGVHSAALFEPKSSNIIFFAEDIGRYNAVDKVIGYGILGGVDFNNLVLIVSGRVFRSLLYKTVKAGIPIIISKAAPTYESVDYAGETGTTLIGFARNKRFNVYSYPERIAELYYLSK